MAPSRLLVPVAVAWLAPAAGFTLLVDINTWSAEELAAIRQVGQHDGTWVLHTNSPGVTDSQWRAAIHGSPIVSEDIAKGGAGGAFAQCQWLSKLVPGAPTYAFSYHETAVEASPTQTLLTWKEVDAYASKCGRKVLALTRAYWPSSDWERHTNAILNHPSLAGVAMEYNPQDFGKRSEDHFVASLLAANRKPFFLWPLTFNGKTTEQNIIESFEWFRAHGVNLRDARVHFVIARYDQPYVPVLGASNSVQSAVQAALRYRAALVASPEEPLAAMAGNATLVV